MSLVGSQDGQQGAGRLEGGGGTGRSWPEQGLSPTDGGAMVDQKELCTLIVSSQAPPAAGLKTTMKSNSRRREVSQWGAGPGQVALRPSR